LEKITRVDSLLHEGLRVAGQSFVSKTTLMPTIYHNDGSVVVLRAVLANPFTKEPHLKQCLMEQIKFGYATHIGDSS